MRRFKLFRADGSLAGEFRQADILSLGNKVQFDKVARCYRVVRGRTIPLRFGPSGSFMREIVEPTKLEPLPRDLDINKLVRDALKDIE